MASPPSASERAGAETVRALAAAHGCPRDCPGCAYARAQQGVPGVVHEFLAFASSRDALRMAIHSKRTGRPFPQVSNDDVIQFCVEEAVFERLHVAEMIADQRGIRDLEDEGAKVTTSSPGPSDPAHRDALERAREFARSGVA